MNFIFMACIVIVVIIYKRKFKGKLETILEDDAKFNRIRHILLGIIFVLSVIWVILSQVIPGSD